MSTKIIPISPQSPPISVAASCAPQRETVFAARAQRFRALAEDAHPLADFLKMLAHVSQAQHQCLMAHPDVPLPTAEQLALSRTHAMPVLPATNAARDPVWRSHLAQIVAVAEPQAHPDLKAQLAQLDKRPAADLERWADRVLHADYAHITEHTELAFLPFVASALQVLWTHQALQPALQPLPRQANPGLCPCCGSLPVSGLIQIGDLAGLRYLHCSLCNTEWNLVRIQCVGCGDNGHITYSGLSDKSGANVFPWAKAECCSQCGGYSKLLYRDTEAQADPVADDMATLLLDMLMGDAGFSRIGLNPFYIPGSGA